MDQEISVLDFESSKSTMVFLRFQTIWKILVKWDHFPQVRVNGEHKNYCIKTTT